MSHSVHLPTHPPTHDVRSGKCCVVEDLRVPLLYLRYLIELSSPPLVMTDCITRSVCHGLRAGRPGSEFRQMQGLTSPPPRPGIFIQWAPGSKRPVPAGAGNFSLHHRVQNGSGAHPASYAMGARGFFPGGKAAGA
jgi:hypothetical protein